MWNLFYLPGGGEMVGKGIILDFNIQEGCLSTKRCLKIKLPSYTSGMSPPPALGGISDYIKPMILSSLTSSVIPISQMIFFPNILNILSPEKGTMICIPSTYYSVLCLSGRVERMCSVWTQLYQHWKIQLQLPGRAIWPQIPIAILGIFPHRWHCGCGPDCTCLRVFPAI